MDLKSFDDFESFSLEDLKSFSTDQLLLALKQNPHLLGLLSKEQAIACLKVAPSLIQYTNQAQKEDLKIMEASLFKKS